MLTRIIALSSRLPDRNSPIVNSGVQTCTGFRPSRVKDAIKQLYTMFDSCAALVGVLRNPRSNSRILLVSIMPCEFTK